MNYRIVDKEGFAIVGLMRRVPLIYHGVNPHITAMWQSLNDELIATLKALSNVEPFGLLSASTNFSEGRQEGGELDHMIGVATTGSAPEGLSRLPMRRERSAEGSTSSGRSGRPASSTGCGAAPVPS